MISIFCLGLEPLALFLHIWYRVLLHEIFNLMPIENYLSDLYEIYRANPVGHWELIYQFSMQSKKF